MTSSGTVEPPPRAVTPVSTGHHGRGRTPPPTEPPEFPGDGEEGMLRMSFFDHLQELHSRILKMVLGLLVAGAISLTFVNQLWRLIASPAVEALTHLGIKPPTLKAITPMEQFNVIWVKLPFLCALFIAAPWVLYQIASLLWAVWGFSGRADRGIGETYGSRYAILSIFVVAAIVTPTPDAVNMLLFALPMCLLFYVGVFAGYLLVLKREGKRFPWAKVLTIAGIVLVAFSAILYFAAIHYKLHPVSHWPFLMR